jgi:hypothetical protein
MSKIYLNSQLLGEYYPGLFYSSTIFERFSIGDFHAGIPFQESDIIQNITTYHESFHSIQDLSSGYFCLINETMRLRDESVIELLQKVIKINNKIIFPLKDNIKTTDSEYLSGRFEEIVSIYKYLQTVLMAFLSGNNNDTQLKALHVIEGAAAFYAEIQRRFQMKIHSLEKDSEIYDFNKIHLQIDQLPPLYSIALKYFRTELIDVLNNYDNKTACDLFLTVCDISLQVPPVDYFGSDILSVHLNPQDHTSLSKHLPGDRFVAIIDFLKRSKVLDLKIPNSRSELFDLLDIKKIDQVISTEKHHMNDETVAFAKSIDNILDKLNLALLDNVCDSWLSVFKHQIKIAYLDNTLKLRLAFMTARKNYNFILSSYDNISGLVTGAHYPSFCKTSWGTWVTCRDFDLDKVIDTQKIIIAKLFIRSIVEQMVVTGIKSCPFADKTIYECNQETESCKCSIDTKDKKYSDCLFGHYFKSFIGIDLHEIQET